MSLALATPIDADSDRLDDVFFALSDPVRRSILERLDGRALLVSELAEPFAISLQAVSRHIQVLVRAGLVTQARSGRISRCSLDAEPLADAEVIACGWAILEALGVAGDTVLEINTLGDKASRDAYRDALVGYFTEHQGALSADSLARLDRNPLRILDSKDQGDRRIIANAPLIAELAGRIAALEARLAELERQNASSPL